MPKKQGVIPCEQNFIDQVQNPTRILSGICVKSHMDGVICAILYRHETPTMKKAPYWMYVVAMRKRSTVDLQMIYLFR